MSSCVKPLTQNIKTRLQPLICFPFFFFGIILFFIFASFLKLNHKNQTTMDEDRHKIEYPNPNVEEERPLQ
jgi:hypothetical protein